MAFPTDTGLTTNSTGIDHDGRPVFGKPFVYTSGGTQYVYQFGRTTTQGEVLCKRASNPSNSWATVGSSWSIGAINVNTVAWDYDGTRYVDVIANDGLSTSTGTECFYRRFDLQTGDWSTTAVALGGGGTDSATCITRSGNGDLYLFYVLHFSNMGKNYRRIYYRRCPNGSAPATAANWSTEAAATDLTVGTTTTVSQGLLGAVADTAGYVYLIYAQTVTTTAVSLRAVSFSPTGVKGSTQTFAGGNSIPVATISLPSNYSIGDVAISGNVIGVAIDSSTGVQVRTVVGSAGSIGASSGTFGVGPTSPTRYTSNSFNIYGGVGIVADSITPPTVINNGVWHVFSTTGTALKYRTWTGGGAGWNTETTLRTITSSNSAIFGGYVRGTDQILGVTYADPAYGARYFDEVVIGSTGVAIMLVSAVTAAAAQPFTVTAGAVSVGLVPVSVAASPVAATLTTGAATTALNPAAATVTAQPFTVSTTAPSVSVTLTPSTATTAAQPFTVSVGAVTVSVVPAVVAGVAQALGSTTSVPAVPVVVTTNAQAFTAAAGPVIRVLAAAAVTFTAQAFTVTAGATTRTLSPAAIAVAAQTLTVLNASPGVSIPLAPATTTTVAPAFTVTPGATIRTAAPTTATVTAQALTPMAGFVTATLTPSTATTAAQPFTVSVGAVTVGLVAAQITASAATLSIFGAAAIISAQPAQIIATAQPLTTTAGPVTVTLAAASVTVTAQPFTLGSVTTVNVASTTATVTAQPLTTTAGPVSVSLAAATATVQASTLTSVVGGVTVTLAAATVALSAITVTATAGQATVTAITAITTVAAQPFTITTGAPPTVFIGAADFGPARLDPRVRHGQLAAHHDANRYTTRPRAHLANSGSTNRLAAHHDVKELTR